MVPAKCRVRDQSPDLKVEVVIIYFLASAVLYEKRCDR
jgi:hypothetical protein